jgi:hypothetical protein|tara:strand:+ start:383 stop:610 length:228 start_codon:yes stop_codon:yes gene_type:complete
MILKVLGPEISIGTANTVANSNLVRVINTGAAAVLNVGSVGNVTVTNTEAVIVEKEPTETLTGTGMVAAPIAFRY